MMGKILSGRKKNVEKFILIYNLYLSIKLNRDLWWKIEPIPEQKKQFNSPEVIWELW